MGGCGAPVAFTPHSWAGWDRLWLASALVCWWAAVPGGLQGYTPVSGPSNQSTLVVGESWGWRLTNGWEWTSAMRYGTGFEAGDAFDQWAPSTVVKVPVGERWNVHAEYFGIFSSQKEADRPAVRQPRRACPRDG